MIKFEDYRKDKEFKIDSLSYNEIFESLKDGIEKAICEFEKIGNVDTLILPDSSGVMNMKYGKDKDMYPCINLEFCVFAGKYINGQYYNCVFNPFEIEIRKIWHGEVKTFTSKSLDQSLINMINEKFPNSDYLVKREKYFKIAEIINNIHNNMLFF